MIGPNGVSDAARERSFVIARVGKSHAKGVDRLFLNLGSDGADETGIQSAAGYRSESHITDQTRLDRVVKKLATPIHVIGSGAMIRGALRCPISHDGRS